MMPPVNTPMISPIKHDERFARFVPFTPTRVDRF